ncbi:MAG: BON domain-containing protein [Actinomycetota bacterium]|nr:BON domain-containing protein [Actinomycetota bacterium]
MADDLRTERSEDGRARYRVGIMSDEYLAQHVREALARDPRVADLGISVKVEPGAVRLSGQVATEQRREGVAVVAREALDAGHEVRNDVTVTPMGQPEDMENVP